MLFIQLAHTPAADRAIGRNYQQPAHVRIIAVDEAQATFQVASQSAPGKSYSVQLRKSVSGLPIGLCNCPARGICKHLTAAYGVWQGILGMRRVGGAQPDLSESPGQMAAAAVEVGSAVAAVRSTPLAAGVLVAPSLLLRGEQYGGIDI